MTKSKASRARALVRKGLIALIQSDLDNYSENLKEVYEECDSEELDVVNQELESIIVYLKGLK